MEVVKSGAEVGKKLGNPVTLKLSEPSSSSATTTTSNPQTISSPSRKVNAYDNGTLNSSSVGQNLNEQLTHPIASLSPYQNKWVIKVRVTAKTAVRTWNNANGEGKLFSMDLLDESGEIRATAFKEMCEKYFDIIQVLNPSKIFNSYIK